MDGWVMGDTPYPVMTTRAPAVLKIMTKTKEAKTFSIKKNDMN